MTPSLVAGQASFDIESFLTQVAVINERLQATDPMHFKHVLIKTSLSPETLVAFLTSVIDDFSFNISVMFRILVAH